MSARRCATSSKPHVEIVPPKTLFEKQAADATYKWLLGMDGGNAIEAVFIPEATRGTLCVSSQIGCGLNCHVLLDRHAGLQPQSVDRGNHRPGLGGGEASGQRAASAAQAHQCRDDGHGRAAAQFRQRRARDESDARRSGFRPGQQARNPVDRRSRADDRQARPKCSDVSLAVSLHAPNDELRTELVPLNKKYPIAELLAACQRYAARRPRTTITFEYTMLKGINDQPQHARELIKLMRQAAEQGQPDSIQHFHRHALRAFRRS